MKLNNVQKSHKKCTRNPLRRNSLIVCASTLLFTVQAFGQTMSKARLEGPDFRVEFNDKGIKSFSSKADVHHANIVQEGGTWGDVDLMYKVDGGGWISIYKQTTETEYLEGERIKYTDYKEGVLL